MGPCLTLRDRYELLQGRVSERALAAGAVPWLRGELVATDGAKARLTAWIDAGGLDAEPDLDDELAALAYYGDEQMLKPVQDALRSLPPPARACVLASALFIGTGWHTAGWCAGSPLRAEYPTLVVLSGAVRDEGCVRRTAVHEMAHVWLEGPSIPIFSAVEMQAYRSRVEYLPTIKGRMQRAEFHAEHLAAAWLGEDIR